LDKNIDSQRIIYSFCVGDARKNEKKKLTVYEFAVVESKT